MVDSPRTDSDSALMTAAREFFIKSAETAAADAWDWRNDRREGYRLPDEFREQAIANAVNEAVATWNLLVVLRAPEAVT